MSRTIPILALGILLSAPASAGVYKWTDAQGNVHFGDRPPAQGAEQIKVPKSSPSTPAPDSMERLRTQQRMLEIYREDRDKEKQAKAEKRRQRKVLKARCAAARDRLHTYQRSLLYDLTAEGERRFLSDSERETAIQDLQDQIQRHCKG
jgi:hypothetical protein